MHFGGVESALSFFQTALISSSVRFRTFGFSLPPGLEIPEAGFPFISTISSLMGQLKIYRRQACARFACTLVLPPFPSGTAGRIHSRC